ncbi:hypothetical protein [Advenella faeciporci]|nr:hypothetical protein [Advenella faeciporci]
MKLVKKATAIACAGVLAGCVNSSSDSAWRLMEEQQQEQAMVQRQEMDDARKKAPEKEQLLIMTIKEAQDQGRYFASLAFIDEHDVKYGKSPDVEILRAEALRKTDQHAQSEEIYRRLTKTRQKAQAWHGLGLMAGQRGDFAEAAKNLENASSAAPSDAVILSDLAYARMRLGDLEGARIPIGKAAELMPQNPKVLSNMALYLLVRGATPAAEQVMQSANLGQQARQEIYAIADQVRRLPPAPIQASGNASSRDDGNQVRGVNNLRASSDEVKKKQDEVVSASRLNQAQNSQQQAFDLQLPASAPLPADIQPRPDAQPQARIQPEPEPQLVNVEQQVARATEPAHTAPQPQQLVRGNEQPLEMAPPTNDPIAMMQPEFAWPPVPQGPTPAGLAGQQAEEKRLAEVSRQQAEEQRQAELAQRQVEEKRQAEVAQQQAEEKRQLELAQQQAEEKRQLAQAQAQQEAQSQQQLVRGNEAPLEMAPPTNDPIAMMQPAFVWPPVTQQQAEEKRQAEEARQQAEQQRQAELAQQQAEQQRQVELAQQQAEQQRQAELAQQQAEQQRQVELAQQQAEQQRQAELAQQQAEQQRQAELAQQQAEQQRQAELAQQQAEEKRLAQAAASKKPVAQTQAIPTARSKGSTSAIDRSILDDVSIVGGDFILKRK